MVLRKSSGNALAEAIAKYDEEEGGLLPIILKNELSVWKNAKLTVYYDDTDEHWAYVAQIECAGGQKGHAETTLTRSDIEEKIASGRCRHEIRTGLLLS